MDKKANREIFFYGNSFWAFYNKQSIKTKEKINRTIGLIKSLELIPEKFFKHIKNTDLYEIRVTSGKNIFRIFRFFEKNNMVIILNGFQKKTSKTPKIEIEKALRLRSEYYEND